MWRKTDEGVGVVLLVVQLAPWAHPACHLSAVKDGGEAWKDGGMTHMNTTRNGLRRRHYAPLQLSLDYHC